MSSSAPHSTPTTSPAFLFYVQEWRSSRSVQRMTFAQRGMYLEMLIEQWDKGCLPDCPLACAEVLGGTEVEWSEAWATLRRKFVDRRSRPRDGIEVHDPSDRDASRQIVNVRLEKVRKARVAYVNAQKLSGKRGGNAKAQKDKRLEASKPIGSLSEPMANPSEPMAMEGKKKEEERKDLISEGNGREVPAPLTNARSKRPIFVGQRLTVFEWMLDDLRRMLGAHFNEFNMDEWFYDLDAKSARAGIVIPQRDGGKWLQEQTLAEASRRGLPIAVALTQGSSKTAGNAAAIARFIARGKPA